MNHGTKNPGIICGGRFSDERGELKFVNDFDPQLVKRFYTIKNDSLDTIRAWQGNRIESKYFHVVSGKFIICLVKIDNWDTPTDDLPVYEYILSAEKSEILYVPAGYANGIKSLENNSNLLVFSSHSLAQAKRGSYRYEADKWYNWNCLGGINEF